MGTSDLVYTINKKNLEANIENVKYYIERIQDVLNGLDKEMADVNLIYKSDASKVFCDKYDTFKRDFERQIGNFNSYVQDLRKVVSLSDDTDDLLSKKVESSASEIKTH